MSKTRVLNSVACTVYHVHSTSLTQNNLSYCLKLRYTYNRSSFLVLLVHARNTCDRSLAIHYSIHNASQNDAFEVHNTSGILCLTSVLQENSTHRVTIQARVSANGRSTVAFTYVIINSIKLADFNLRTKVDFEVTKLGFLKEASSRLSKQDFGFFVNDHPGTQGVITASVGRVTTLASYNRMTEPAIYVSAVVVRRQVWYEDPVLRVVAHVRDGAFSARTDPDKSKIVLRVRGSENLPLTSGGSRTIQVCVCMYLARTFTCVFKRVLLLSVRLLLLKTTLTFAKRST